MGEVVHGVCACVYVWWLVSLFSQQHRPMKPLPCWCLSLCQQVIPARWRGREREKRWREIGEEKGGGQGFKSKKTSLFSAPLNIYCSKKKAAFSIFDVLLSSTWTATSLKLTRTKLEQMKRWKCQWGKKKTWRSATTRFTHGCLLALLFRFTYFKTCVSKGKHSHSQAFSIDHLSMQAVWPGTNRFFTFPIHFVTIQPSVSNFTWCSIVCKLLIDLLFSGFTYVKFDCRK